MAASSRRIVIATFGSLGDLFPYLAIARELQARGHRPIIATARQHQNLVEKAGVEFTAIRPDLPPPAEMEQAFAPVMDARGGTRYLFETLILPQLRASYEDLKAVCRDADLLLTHSLVPAGPLVAQSTQMRWVSAVISPIFLASRRSPPRLPIAPQVGDYPIIGKVWSRVLLRIIQQRMEPILAPIAELREELNLVPGEHPLFAGQHSPHRVLGLFSPSWARPQTDWPPQTRLTGFCVYDGSGESKNLPHELEKFLAAGAPPVVFTLGASSIHDARDFFEESVKAIQSTQMRALIIAGDKISQMSGLSPNIFVTDYAPLSQVLPRAAAVVHHGGAGTGALALRAGCPMLIVPQANDQPDNAVRFRGMGVSRVLWRHEYRAARVAAELHTLFGSVRYSHRATQIQQSMANENGAIRAGDWIEESLSL